MIPASWTQAYDVNTMLVNPQKRLGLVGLLNILQDIAWIHGSQLGHGFEAMLARGSLWVLTRQDVAMTDWPAWGETVELHTWVRPITGMMALRDTEIRAGGRRLGEGTAAWLALDLATRRPLRLHPGDMPAAAAALPGLALTPARIAPRDDLRAVAGFEVRNSDLDVNGHVNNTRYAQWILDALPLDAQRAFRVARYEANFLAETHVGDRIAIEHPGLEGSVLHVQGRREADARVVFVARLHVVPRQDAPPSALPSAAASD